MFWGAFGRMERAHKNYIVLPDNFVSRHVIDYLKYKSIFTSSILLASNRIDIYFLERGADLKGRIVYDQ